MCFSQASKAMSYSDFKTALAHATKSIEVVQNSQQQLSQFYQKLYDENDEMKNVIRIAEINLAREQKWCKEAEDSRRKLIDKCISEKNDWRKLTIIHRKSKLQHLAVGQWQRFVAFRKKSLIWLFTDGERAL